MVQVRRYSADHFQGYRQDDSYKQIPDDVFTNNVPERFADAVLQLH